MSCCWCPGLVCYGHWHLQSPLWTGSLLVPSPQRRAPCRALRGWRSVRSALWVSDQRLGDGSRPCCLCSARAGRQGTWAHIITHNIIIKDKEWQECQLRCRNMNINIIMPHTRTSSSTCTQRVCVYVCICVCVCVWCMYAFVHTLPILCTISSLTSALQCPC